MNVNECIKPLQSLKENFFMQIVLSLKCQRKYNRFFIVIITFELRGHQKIDLITLNIKLTLRGRGVSHGFGIDVKKNEKKQMKW